MTKYDLKAYIKGQKIRFLSHKTLIPNLEISTSLFSQLQTLRHFFGQDHYFASLGKWLLLWINILYAWESMYIMMVMSKSVSGVLLCFCKRCVVFVNKLEKWLVVLMKVHDMDEITTCMVWWCY